MTDSGGGHLIMHIKTVHKFRPCETCKQIFQKDSPNQKYCQPCRAEMPDYLAGQIMKYILKAEPRLKLAADLSGNAKVYRAEEYGQEFLRRLVGE